MSKQLIITGFHRSGTSMLAQELKNAGLFIGEHLMDPGISNADGHFEDMDFFYLQERLLHINGTNWQYTGDKTLSVPSYFDSHANALVAQRDKAYDVWGFKDPRSALFLPYWRERLETPRVLAIYRHYEICANSLLHRAAGEIAYGNSVDVSLWEDHELPYRMWLAYNRQIIAYVLAHPEETLLLSHHAVVNGFDVLSKVNQCFDLSLNTDVESSIKTELITPLQKSSLSLSSSLRQELDEVWEALEKISAAPAKTLPVLKQKHNPTEPLPEIRTLLTSLHIPIEENNDLLATLVEAFLDESQPLEERLTSMHQHLKTFVTLGERAKYIEVYKKLLVRYPENIVLYQKLAEIYQAEKAYKKQEAILLKMYAVTPPKEIYPYYPSLLANCYTIQNDFKQAFFYIDRAIKGNPKNLNFYLIKSRIFYTLCRYDEMFEQIDMAIENAVNENQTINFTLHKVERFVMIGRHEEGKTLLLSLQDQYPDDSRIEKKQSLFDVAKPMNREEFYASTQTKLRESNTYAFKLLSLLEIIPRLEVQQDIAERIRQHLKKLMHKSVYIENTHISFLVDDLPLHYFQAELLLYSIEKNTSFDKSKVIVHCTTRVKDDFINFLKNNGYNYKIVEPYLDGKYCNKLQQLEHFREKKVNVILLDADMFALDNFEILNPYTICGKIVDAPNPPIHILKRIYKEANIEEPSLVLSDWDIQDNSTFSSNFNGGFYYIPLDYVDTVSIEWKKWASWLYERREGLFDTKQQAIHTDQVSMSLTINSLGIPYTQLTANSNCPTHTDRTPTSLEIDNSIKLLHYHRELNTFGLINDAHISNPKIKEAIKDANTSIASMNQSLFYEEFCKSSITIADSFEGEEEIEERLKVLASDLPEGFNLILHAGTPKTGTTSLQFFMDEQRDTLLQHGVLYAPADGVSFAPKHQWIVNTLKSENFTLFLEHLENVLRAANNETHTLILSTEGIYNHWWDYSPEAKYFLSLLKKYFQVQIWVWFREPVSFAESLYRQYLKNPQIAGIDCYGKDLSLDEMLQDPWFVGHLDYVGFLQECELLFGKEQTVAFELKEDIIETVCNRLDISFSYKQPTKHNEKLTCTMVEALRIFNRKPMSIAQKSTLIDQLYEIDKNFSQFFEDKKICNGDSSKINSLVSLQKKYLQSKWQLFL